MAVHPLQSLSRQETELAKDLLLAQHYEELLIFREMYYHDQIRYTAKSSEADVLKLPPRAAKGRTRIVPRP